MLFAPDATSSKSHETPVRQSAELLLKVIVLLEVHVKVNPVPDVGASEICISSIAKPSNALQVVPAAKTKRKITPVDPTIEFRVCFAVTHPPLPPVPWHDPEVGCILPDHPGPPKKCIGS